MTADILSEIAELFEERGTPVLFVLIPSHYQVDPQILGQHASAMGFDPDQLDVRQPNRLLGERLRARGLHVMDALPTFRAARRERKQLYGTVDPHFAPEGHRVLWQMMEEPVIHIIRTGDVPP